MRPPCARLVPSVPRVLFALTSLVALAFAAAAPARAEEAPPVVAPAEPAERPAGPPSAEPEPPAGGPGTEGGTPEEPAAEGGELQPTTDLSTIVLPVPEIGITAARSEREVLDVPGNVNVITRQTIEESGARNVPDLLRREAGVFVTNTTTNREGYTVEIRGFNNGGGNGSATLVMIDGRRVNEPSSGSVDWTFVPLDVIDSIEIVRGPASALYGDNAEAGVIHIRTLRPERGVRGVLTGRAGTYDTYDGTLWVGGSAGLVSASAYVLGGSTDGYRDRSGLHNGRGQLDLAVDLAGHGTLGIRGGYDSGVRNRPGALTQEEIDVDRRQAAPGSDQDFDRAREQFGQLYGDVSLTEDLTWRLDAWHRRRTDHARTSDPFFAFATDADDDSNGLGTWLELDVEPLGHRLRSSLGVDLLQEDRDFDSTFEFFPSPATTSATRARRRVYGIFFQSELNLTDDLILSGGVRRDEGHYRGEDRLLDASFKAQHSEWAPKAALVWRIIDPVSVYASYSRGFRFPNFDEAFGIFGFSPGLVPQTSDNYEVGVKVRTECVSLNFAIYQMDVEDEIFLDPLAPNPFTPFLTGVNVNIDRVRHRGLELQGSVRPTGWLELYGSYTLDDVTFQFDPLTHLDGYLLPITPRHRGTVGAIVTLPFGFEVGANANYVGSRYLANDVMNRFPKLPSYASYDLRVAWGHEFGESVSFLVDAVAYNVTGRAYEEFGGLSLFSPRIGFFPSPERSYMVGARLEFRR